MFGIEGEYVGRPEAEAKRNRDNPASRRPGDDVEMVDEPDIEVLLDRCKDRAENTPRMPPPSSAKIWKRSDSGETDVGDSWSNGTCPYTSRSCFPCEAVQ